MAELGPAQPQLVLFSFFLCGLLSEYICFILYTEDHSTSILTYLAEKNGPNMVLSVGTKQDFDLCRVSFDDVEYFCHTRAQLSISAYLIIISDDKLGLHSGIMIGLIGPAGRPADRPPAGIV